MSAATIGAIFVVVGLIGVLARPPSREPLRQVDPYLAILETLVVLFAVVLVIMMAAVYAYAPPERKTFSLVALAFTICFSITTCGVHFASLTLGRQVDPKVLPLLFHQLSTGDWPTLAMSLDLLAWDFFLGLALVFAAPVFKGEATRRVRASMTAAGTLCLAGTLGPASGHLHIQYFGIAGYAFVLPLACALLATFFRQERGAGVRTGRSKRVNPPATCVTAIVVAHLLVTIPHGLSHLELRVGLDPRASIFVIVVVLICPLLAMALVWTTKKRIGLILLSLSMFGSLLFGFYHHFLVASPDHVRLQPASAWGIVFVLTAYGLLITEAIGAYVGIHFLWIARGISSKVVKT